MPDYIVPPLTTLPDELSDEAFAYLEDRIPGWLPSPGNLEVWLIEALAQLAGDLTDVASTVPTTIFRYFGSSLLNLPPTQAVPATGLTTWTMIDNLGYTIPQGTLVGIAATGDELLVFETVGDTVIAPGDTVATGVTVIAQDPSAQGNELTSAPELIDSLVYVASITLDEPTSGGADAETDDHYLNRLRALLQLLTPRPILPNDFSALAKTIPGVERATTIDLYNATSGTANIERCVTVAVTDANGDAVSAPVKAAVLALLQSMREVNFLVFVIDPTYNYISVDFAAVAYPGFDAPSVQAAAIQAVTDYLNPKNFGAAPFGEGDVWFADTEVRYLEVAEVINRTAGLRYITALTVGGGTADITLTGIAPLTKPGTITGTVT